MYQCRLCYKDLPSRISIFNNSLYFVNRCTVCFQVFKSLSYSILSCCLKVNKTHLHWRQLHNLHIRLMRQEIIGIDLRVLCHGLSLIAILINARLCAALSGGFFVPVAVLRPAGSGRNLRRGFPVLHLYFNPRSPCGERHGTENAQARHERFQSTLPVWGATLAFPFPFASTLHFNPRSPCGERLVRREKTALTGHFNPRSPCGERPARARPLWCRSRYFNPRSPCGERPCAGAKWSG